MSFVKIIVFVPINAADRVRAALAEAGCGRMGAYDACSFSSRGIGRFRPRDGAHPTIGAIGQYETVEEERIEVICPRERVGEALKSVRSVHPYEEPAIDIIALIDPSAFA